MITGFILLASVASGLAQQHIPGQHDFIKVEVQITQLINEEGLLAAGGKCDVTGECDPRITVYLDTDQPLSAWPGAKATADYSPFFNIGNANSPLINKQVSTNVCGGSVNKINLRAHVVDDDVFSHDSVIDDFECQFAADYRTVFTSDQTADWSPTQDCRPRLQNGKVKLQFRYRLYDIAQSDCGIIQAPTQVRVD